MQVLGHTGELTSHALLTYADVCLRMHVLGHTGELTSHALLNLAAKFPGLYVKAMARNAGSFAAADNLFQTGI